MRHLVSPSLALCLASVLLPACASEAGPDDTEPSALGSVASAATGYLAGVPVYSVDGRCLHVSTIEATKNAVTRACSPGITAETFQMDGDRIKTPQGCLAPATNPAGTGALLLLQTCDPLNTNQGWDFNHGKIVHTATKLCLASTTPDGGNVQLASCAAGRTTSWMVSTYAQIMSNGLCIDARGAQTTDGTVVQLYACNATSAQRWRRTYENGAGQFMGPGGKCLHVAGGQVVDHASVVLGPCTPTTNAVFWMTNYSPIIAYGPGPNGYASMCVAPRANNELELRFCALVPNAIFSGMKPQQAQAAPLTITAFPVNIGPVINAETTLRGFGTYVYGRTSQFGVSPLVCPSGLQSQVERMNVFSAQWDLMWSGCDAISDAVSNVAGTSPIFFLRGHGTKTDLVRVNGTAPFASSVLASNLTASGILYYDLASSWLYWSGPGITGMPADGSASPKYINAGTQRSVISASDDTYLFANEQSSVDLNVWSVVRYRKSDGARYALTNGGVGYPFVTRGLFVDPSYVYYVGSDNYVHRVSKYGGGDVALVRVGPNSFAYTVSATRIYWLETDPSPGATLWQASKDGTNVQPAETGLSIHSGDLTYAYGVGRMAWRDENGVRVISEQ